MIKVSSNYNVDLNSYSGPLDLLLKLIEKKQLDICEISLAQVTEEYINTIAEIDSASIEKHNWFLDIAVRLILAKSRALLPNQESIEDSDSIEDLTEQLKLLAIYQKRGRQLLRAMKSPHKKRKSSKKVSSGPFKNLNNISLSYAYQHVMNTNRVSVTTKSAPIKLKRQSIRALQLVLLKQWKKNKRIQISHISQTQPNRAYSVAIFSLVLEYIHANKAQLVLEDDNYVVELK